MIDPGLFPEPGLALLAVSGGPDSVALLRLMHAQADALRVTLAVGHVDHGIHPDSAAWADRVQALAVPLGVPVHVERLALGAGTAETAAREARYAALERMRQACGARWIVLAHHADDQIETVLFRVLRGSAPAGLAGMEPVTGHLVRPLLRHRRADLAPYAAGAIVDPSNTDPRHDRSWIRGTLLPALRERFPAVEEHLLTLADHAAADREAWDLAVTLVPGLRPEVDGRRVSCSRKAMAGLDPVLAAAVLRALVRRAGLQVRPKHAARLVDFLQSPAGGRTLELGGGVVAEVHQDRLTVRPPA